MPSGHESPGWRRLIQGTGLSLGLRLGGAGLGLGFNVLLARVAGAEGAGLFFLAMSVSGLLTLASRLGLDAIAVRQTAARATRGQWLEVAAGARVALGITLCAGVVAALGIWILAPTAAGVFFDKPALAPLLRGLAFAIVPGALSVVLAELLRGAHSLLRSQALQVLVASAVALLLLALAGTGADANAAVWAQVAGSVVACALGAWWWRRTICTKLRDAKGGPRAGEGGVIARAGDLLHSAMPLFWFSMLSALMGSMDILVLGRLGSASDVGVYGVAVRLAMLTSFILLAANSYAGPYYASFYAHGDMNGLRRLAIRSAQVTTACALPLLALFMVFPSYCLGLFGREFSFGGGVLTILAIGQFVNVATGSAGQVLIMTGHERDLRNTATLAAATVLIGLVLLVPRWGAEGAAVATAVGVLLHKFAATALVRKRLGITIHAFAH